jgi:hypothetical protein
VVSVVSVNIVINVKGDAKRKGIILDVVPESFSSESAGISTYFKNTGTTTMTAVAYNKVYDSGGNLIHELKSPSSAVKPGATNNFKTNMDMKGINSTNVSVHTEVDFITGHASKDGYIELSDTVILQEEYKTDNNLLIAILIIIAIIIISVYIVKSR